MSEPHSKCHPGSSMCPAVLKTDRGTYVVIGNFIRHEDYDKLVGRIGPGEVAIEISAELLEGALQQNMSDSKISWRTLDDVPRDGQPVLMWLKESQSAIVVTHIDADKVCPWREVMPGEPRHWSDCAFSHWTRDFTIG